MRNTESRSIDLDLSSGSRLEVAEVPIRVFLDEKPLRDSRIYYRLTPSGPDSTTIDFSGVALTDEHGHGSVKARWPLGFELDVRAEFLGGSPLLETVTVGQEQPVELRFSSSSETSVVRLVDEAGAPVCGEWVGFSGSNLRARSGWDGTVTVPHGAERIDLELQRITAFRTEQGLYDARLDRVRSTATTIDDVAGLESAPGGIGIPIVVDAPAVGYDIWLGALLHSPDQDSMWWVFCRSLLRGNSGYFRLSPPDDSELREVMIVGVEALASGTQVTAFAHRQLVEGGALTGRIKPLVIQAQRSKGSRRFVSMLDGVEVYPIEARRGLGALAGAGLALGWICTVDLVRLSGGSLQPDWGCIGAEDAETEAHRESAPSDAILGACYWFLDQGGRIRLGRVQEDGILLVERRSEQDSLGPLIRLGMVEED